MKKHALEHGAELFARGRSASSGECEDIKALHAKTGELSMEKGFLYLAAVIDWHSRKAPTRRLSNTLGAGFCIEAAEEAIVCYGAPDVFNTDQGSEAFKSVLKAHGARIHGRQGPRLLDNASWSACGAVSNRKKSTGEPTRP